MSPTPPAGPERLPDWEAFYRDYRKPGYVAGFEITSKLGGGAFGLVFRARKESIGKDYAIKFLKVEDGEVRQAVLRELEQVQYFAQVDHPNLVQIEDRGEVDGIPYLVMQYAGSDTLRDRMPKDGTAARGEALAELLGFYLQACRGVSALHARSLVHFDLKPANVFLKGPVARVGDYGLSKLVTHSRGSLTMGRGTPYYMAPEMLQRRGDHRSDIYSLGVMLYELLCGQVPFTGDSEWEVLKKHEKDAPVFPAGLTPVQRAVLQRCLQKDPDARFQSVHDIVQALGEGAAATSSRGPAPEVEPEPARAGGTADPYAGFREASREAYKHAREIAREALASAREVSQQAAKKAREVMQDTMQQTRAQQRRRWRDWREQRRAHREAMRRARAVMTPPPLPRTRRRSGWVALPAAFLVFVFFGYTWLAASGTPQQSFAVASPATPEVTEPAAIPRAVHVGAENLYRQWTVPLDLEIDVSATEPEWAMVAEHDLPQAGDLLDQRLSHLAEVAPFRHESRAAGRPWPKFELQRDPVREHLVDDFLRADCYDEGSAAALAIDAATLATVASRFDAFDYGDKRDLARAARLQQLLVFATGVETIELAAADGTRKSELRAQNRGLGTAWQWLLHEIAFSPSTWQAFRQLRGR
ncbi:MAG: serine/threonine-protein kinase [Planctomycetota bacterium]